jgi:hypothetical protein
MRLIPVLVEAGDGPLFVLHTEDEYERLMRGVDAEAAWLALAPLDEPEEGHV